MVGFLFGGSQEQVPTQQASHIGVSPFFEAHSKMAGAPFGGSYKPEENRVPIQ